MKIFAYGTLRDESTQIKVLGRTLSGLDDAIIGYEVVNNMLIEGKRYPNLRPCATGMVDGTVFNLTFKDITKVSEYETDAYGLYPIVTTGGRRVFVYKGEK
jgi:gamma-glutamylcyclotransferase (GGCT)/AIG2-like uncharacterized protein YtfP